MARWKMVVSWVLQVLCVLLFVLIEAVKFVDPAWERNFARWGYPDGSYLVVGSGSCASSRRVWGERSWST